MKRSVKHRGFTLIELMVVIAIVALLVAIAYPNYRDSVRRANRSEGQSLLTEAMARQERFFSNNNTYTTNLTGALPATGLGFSNPPVSENGYYLLSAAACGGGIGVCVNMTATAQGGQADDTACATMSLDSTGARTSTGGGNCW